MASGAAKDAAVLIGTATAPTTATEISTYLTRVTPKQAGKVIDVTTLGNAWSKNIRGLNNFSFDIEGVFDPFMGTLLFNLGTANEVVFQYGPQGTATGKQKYSGSALLSDYSPPANLDEAVTFAATFVATGAVSVGTF